VITFNNLLNLFFRFLLAFFLVLMPFTNLFAFTQIISLPFIFSTLIGLIVIFDVRFYHSQFALPTLFSILFLGLVLISFCINIFNFQSFKPFNHLFAYFFTILFYYLFVRHATFISKLSFYNLIKYISIGVIITSIFTIIEFLAKNIYYPEFDSLFFRPAVSDYQPYSGIETLVIRARSTVEESGHYALYLIAFAPLTIQYLYNKKTRFKLFLSSIIIISFLLTFSVAGIIASVVGLILLFLTSFKNIKFLKTSVVILLSFVCLNLILGVLFDLSLIENVLLKFTDSSSSVERFDRFNAVFNVLKNGNIFNYIFGYGPAAYDTLKVESFLNLYLVFGIELGVLTLFIFIFFLLYILLNWFKSSNEYTNCLKFSFLACLVHYNSIHNYFYPWFWVLLIIIEVNQKRRISE